MWRRIYCCVLVFLLLAVTWAAPQESHDHSKDHHKHLHHGKDEPHPSHDGADDLCHKLSSPNADFAFSLYKKLSTQPEAKGKNIFFSPLSISMALSMLALGAKGDTHSQIFGTLGYSALTPDQVNEGYEHLLHMLDHSQDAMQLEVGSALAIREGFKAVDKFLKDAQHYYQAEAFTVDYSKPEVAVKEVNKYIAKKNKDMITDMVETLDSQTVMMLINYIYFRGKWEDPFKARLTRKDNFKVDENTNVTVDMMSRSGRYKFYRDQENSTSIITVPYKGNTSMIIALPDEGKMAELEKNICGDLLKNWHEKLSKISLVLQMPKFSTSASISLDKTLQELGITNAFTDAADLSGISEGTKLKVSKALHQAVLKVDEQGTEAAATTTIEIMLTSSRVTEFMILNRPFLVFIVDANTRGILFMGKINNPTA